MGKKKTGKQYISVGVHSNVGASLTRETRFVVLNPNKEETHKQFITVDGKDFFSSKPQGKSF